MSMNTVNIWTWTVESATFLFWCGVKTYHTGLFFLLRYNFILKGFETAMLNIHDTQRTKSTVNGYRGNYKRNNKKKTYIHQKMR